MASMVGRLPAGFQTDPVLAKAVDSSLSSVTSGIQAAGQASPAEVGDLMESFAACFPPIGQVVPSPERLNSFSDAGVVQPPDSYLNNARQLGGEDALTGFSDLIPMNQVAEKLSDPKFDHQKSLQSFSAALSNLELPGDPNAPVQPGQAKSANVLDTESQAFIVNWSQPQGEVTTPKVMDAESQAFVIDWNQPTDAGAQKVSGESKAFVIEGGEPESESKAFVINWESRGIILQDSTPSQDASIVQVLRDFQTTVQGIVNLNQQVEGEQSNA